VGGEQRGGEKGKEMKPGFAVDGPVGSAKLVSNESRLSCIEEH
jgi:hypothetical protein